MDGVACMYKILDCAETTEKDTLNEKRSTLPVVYVPSLKTPILLLGT